MRGLVLLSSLTLLLPSVVLPAACQQPRPQVAALAFSQAFQAAYASYVAGNLPDAATRLEQLLAASPGSFEAHELLGLVYAAQTRDGSAITQLQAAVTLKPESVSAINNLATALARSGETSGAELAWKRALAIDLQDYAANRNLARLYLQRNEVSAALPLLHVAHRIKPDAVDNTYDLALADLLSDQLTESRALAAQLLHGRNLGEYHNLLGRVDEKEAKYIEAANEFATAARTDPSEDNLFVWASELMVHRAYESAIAVFDEGTRRFPTSPRLWVGKGMALYSRGDYEPALKALLTATDLNAVDPRCYLFLSKAYLSSPSQADQVIERFRKYAALEPNNARAQFYYAISLWKGRRAASAEIDYATVERLLLRSAALDDTNPETHLQLGILYNDQHAYDKAQQQYVRALELDQNLADAHFRLGRAYLRTGNNSQAQAEFDRFKALQAQHQAEVDKERAEVQQFVIATNAASASAPSSQP